jgi:TetR/AcrR family transcriptional repressor of nem operon
VGRPRDFDVNRALDVAVRLFWAQGYAATSVRQLCEEMGIRPGSFYAAFDTKDACFRQALARYLAGQGLPREPGPAAVRAWFGAIVAPSRRGKGCLLVSSAAEHPSLEAGGRQLVTGHLSAMEDFFAACLGGRPGAREDAALLAAAVIAVHVLSRSGASPARLRRIARRALIAAGLDDS